MADEPENIVLHYLRRIAGDVAEMRREHREDMREVRMRLGNLEQGHSLGQMTDAERSIRLDRFVDRIERIERRLDLVDPGA